MASSQIQHYIHPHPLCKASVPVAFNCNGCNTFGSGVSYQCSACDFNLHEECATAPSTISSHHHLQHRLTLTNCAGKAIGCYVCGEKVNGIGYTCPPCDFGVHPLCIKSPMVSSSLNRSPLEHNHHHGSSKIQHFTHPCLLYKLTVPFTFNCNCCNTIGSGITYRCSACDFDLHEDCANALSTISSHHHPQHHLTLVNKPEKAIGCNVCGQKVNGHSYSCLTCDLYVHPLCTKIPMMASHHHHQYYQQQHHQQSLQYHFHYHNHQQPDNENHNIVPMVLGFVVKRFVSYITLGILS